MSSQTNPTLVQTEIAPDTGEKAALRILLALTFCHLLNDAVQSLLPAIYPLLKSSFHLDFGQVGLIAFTLQMTASLLQPLVGLYTDHCPKPYSLAFGMGFTLIGLLVLSMAPTYGTVLVAAALVGVGSSVFHPESSRVARMASGGQHGMAQSLFQLGGNAGSALGPLLAAVVLPRGQSSIAWFSFVALLGIIMLADIGSWAKKNRPSKAKFVTTKLEGESRSEPHVALPTKRVAYCIAILMALMFSKYIYLASISSYYIFYLMDKFHLSLQNAQIHLFVFLGAVAAGTIIGGPVGDRIGRKYVIWCSILGVLPFTLLLPYANLLWTGVLSVVIGLILASAFSAILVYAQELVPGRVGMIAGLFFGLAFGAGGVGAAMLGKLADLRDIRFVYHVCSFLPLVGLLTAFLPNLETHSMRAARKSPA
jgi:MFS transporter, FSR family, fosmidomycin resistance protein